MNELMMQNENALATRTQLADLLPSFEAYLKRRGVSRVTIDSYFVGLRSFGEWMRNNMITNPTPDDIANFVSWLALPHARRQRIDRPHSGAMPVISFSAGTQARYLRAVKLFFKWAALERLWANVADGIGGAKVCNTGKRDALQREDARALLDSINTETETGKRDYAMILLSITAGLRIIEMQRAKIKNLEMIAGEHVLFVQGKGHKEADTYKKLTPEVYSAIAAYLDTRSTKDADSPLFAGIGNRSREKALTEPSISRIIKDRMKAAGYDTHRLSAHSLRHSSVTFLLESGATIQEAQHHARHASPETTGIYAHNIDQRKQHTEQRVYDYLFDIEQDTAAQAADCMKRMNADQQKRALELLRAIAG